MKSFRWSIALLVALAPSIGYGQAPRLPRDPDKLISRAQSFWAVIAAGQRSKAIDFVHPAKREIFLAGTPLPLIAARVIGVNLTTDLQRASVRVELDLLGADAGTPRLTWSLDSVWVWSAGAWYLDMSDPLELFRARSSPGEDASAGRTRSEIDADLQFPTDSFDLGTVTSGQRKQLQISMKYTGSLPLSIDSAASGPFVSVTAAKNVVTKDTDYLVLTFDSAGLEGPVSIPFQVRFRHEGVSVQRTLVLKANVFVPISFRQVPAVASIKGGQPISVFIRNNTSDPVALSYMTVDGLLEIVSSIQVLDANQETEVRFSLKPGLTPENLLLIPKAPVSGLGQFSFHFRTEP